MAERPRRCSVPAFRPAGACTTVRSRRTAGAVRSGPGGNAQQSAAVEQLQQHSKEYNKSTDVHQSGNALLYCPGQQGGGRDRDYIEEGGSTAFFMRRSRVGQKVIQKPDQQGGKMMYAFQQKAEFCALKIPAPTTPIRKDGPALLQKPSRRRASDSLHRPLRYRSAAALAPTG